MADFPPVLTKADFVERYIRGEFGNHSPTWGTRQEYLADGYKGLVHIRNRVAGARTWYNVPPEGFERAWAEALRYYRADQLYISAMAPTDKTVFQGEVQRGLWGLDLYYSCVARPMREALRLQGRTVRGVFALCLLQRFLCPNSYEWLQVLLDRYPDHVVEFSTYSVNWGTLPGYNTVFWEVRLY